MWKTNKRLRAELAEADHKITERERKKWFDEKLKLIAEYESKIITESETAANERELTLLTVIDAKNEKIRKLEMQLSDQRMGYRKFKDEINRHEIIIDNFCTKLDSASRQIAKMAGEFHGIKDEMDTLAVKVERKDRKLIEG